MILFVKSRAGDQFQGTVWYPDPITNNGLASVSGRIEANGVITFSERRIQGSLKRIAATKAMAQGPLPLDTERFALLCFCPHGHHNLLARK